MDIQLKKGLLDAGVLFRLNAGDSYGYKITADVNKTIPVSETALYPVLRRLEAQELLETYTQEHNGRLRKYYAITEAGRAQCGAVREELMETINVIKGILDMGEEEQKNDIQ